MKQRIQCKFWYWFWSFLPTWSEQLSSIHFWSILGYLEGNNYCHISKLTGTWVSSNDNGVQNDSIQIQSHPGCLSKWTFWTGKEWIQLLMKAEGIDTNSPSIDETSSISMNVAAIALQLKSLILAYQSTAIGVNRCCARTAKWSSNPNRSDVNCEWVISIRTKTLS